MSPIVLTLFVVFALLGHGYLWVEVTNLVHARSWPRKIVDGITLVCAALFAFLPVICILTWQDLDLSLSNIYRATPSWLASYLYLCAAWGIAKLVIRSIHRYQTDPSCTLVEWRQEDLDVPAKLDQSVYVGNVPQVLAKVPGNQALRLTVDHKKLAIPNLGANHAGLTIAHISDLHMTGRMDLAWYQAVTREVNALQADVIAVTGDIVEVEECWPWLAETLGTLRAKFGVYFVLGNHDYYIDVQRTRSLLEEHGLICLSENSLSTEWNDARVVLAGNEYPWSKQTGKLPTASERKAEASELRMVLMHTPDEFDWACEQQADLALAGHTHGGQLRFPILGPIVCPSRFGTRYACGVFRRGNTVMHVSRGVAGKTPLRWNCLPEISLLELVRN